MIKFPLKIPIIKSQKSVLPNARSNGCGKTAGGTAAEKLIRKT